MTDKIANLTEEINELAKDVKFIQRETCSINGVEFVYLMSVIMFADGDLKTLETQCEDLKRIFDIDITPDTLSKRQNRKMAAKFLKKVYELLLKNNIDEIIERNPVFDKFNNVFLVDSSIITFNKIMSDFFKSSGGGSKKSSFKLNLIFNIAKMSVTEMSLYTSNQNDQSLADEIIKHLNKDDLYIADLGYFSLKLFKKIGLIFAYYLSRLKHETNIYLDKDGKDKFNLLKFLQKQNKNIVDLGEIYIGAKDRLKARIIAFKLPKDIAEERIRKKKASIKEEVISHQVKSCCGVWKML